MNTLDFAGPSFHRIDGGPSLSQHRHGPAHADLAVDAAEDDYGSASPARDREGHQFLGEHDLAAIHLCDISAGICDMDRVLVPLVLLTGSREASRAHFVHSRSVAWAVP